jgi:four helix bundle protein
MKHNLNQLKVWKKSIDMVVDVYKVTASFPKAEIYGLTSQTRRSAVSVPSNIAEGAGRNTDGEFVQFLGISNGSSYELMTQLIVARELGLIESETVQPVLDKIDEIQKMTWSLKQSLIPLKA